MRIIPAASITFIAISCIFAATLRESPADETAVRGLVDRYVTAYNQGDVQSAASLFADRSRAERYLSPRFTGRWKGSNMTLTMTKVRFTGPDVGVAWVDYSVTGVKNPDGQKSSFVNGHAGVLFKKKHGTWLMIPAEGTMPFNIESYATERR